MASPELGIVRTNSANCIAQKLPDGSMAIFEVMSKNVYSLNPSAAAAWDACESATTLPRLAAAMSVRLNAPISEDLARQAVSELAAVGLVSVTSAEELGTSRRSMLKQVAGVALPVVLVLTGAEQRAHAQGAGSEPGTTPPGTTSPGTTSPGTTSPGTTSPGTTSPSTTPPGTTPIPRGAVPLQIIKSLGDPRVAMAGAEFDVKNAQGQVVAHLITDANGMASVLLQPGTYTLVETNAPGGLAIYVPFGVHTVTLDPQNGAIRDFSNFLQTTGPGTTAPGTTSAPGTTPAPGRGDVPLQIIKSLGEPRVPLAGAEFDVKNAQGQVVAHLITDSNGTASVLLPPATYTLVETNAPGGLGIYVPFGDHTVTLDPQFGAIRDFSNFLKTTS